MKTVQPACGLPKEYSCRERELLVVCWLICYGEPAPVGVRVYGQAWARPGVGWSLRKPSWAMTSFPSSLQRTGVGFCSGEVESGEFQWASPALFWLAALPNATESSPFPATALLASRGGLLAQRDFLGTFGSHFSLPLISRPAHFPAPCESQWVGVGQRKGGKRPCLIFT